MLPISTEANEIQRLKALLPDNLQSRTAIVRATEVKSSLIQTEQVERDRFAIQVDLVRWQQLPLDQRNLLFWHEAARVQNRTVKQFPKELVVLGASLSASLLEVVGQNVLLLTASLLVAGLAGYQLYQRNRGERSLREATQADQDAMTFAKQFGYSTSHAYGSLYDALNTLMKQTDKKGLKNKIKTRLRVLEISSEQGKTELQPLVEMPSYSTRRKAAY